MYKIGIQYTYYPEERNIINKIDKATYIKISTNVNLITRIIKKVKRVFKIKSIITKPTTKAIYSYKSKYRPAIDFFHFFNSILYGKNNWGVTFETAVPYHEDNKISIFLRGESVIFNSERDVKKLFMPNCKFIIAISECSFNIQREYLNHFPSFKNDILNKMHVLHPPQELLMHKYKKPDYSNGINFMFVGSEFLCKGGIEILRVFNKIKDYYSNFNLILVGDFNKTNGRCFISNNEIDELQSVIKDNVNRISYFKKMPNNEVLINMLENTHVGLLPTHADTYGYSVLEFQATGCPVISTDIRALPEINSKDCGWLIEIPKSNLGEPFSRTDEELIVVQDIIENQLMKIMVEILDNPALIKLKAENAMQRIKDNHSVRGYSNKLLKIYNEVM